MLTGLSGSSDPAIGFDYLTRDSGFRITRLRIMGSAAPHQSAGEGTSIEWSKVLGGLADTDGVDR